MPVIVDQLVQAVVNVFPDFDAVGGREAMLKVLGALLTVVLVIAVLMVLISAIVWAIASSHGNVQAATRGRAGVFVALGTAAVAGAGVAWMNFLVDVGTTI